MSFLSLAPTERCVWLRRSSSEFVWRLHKTDTGDKDHKAWLQNSFEIFRCALGCVQKRTNWKLIESKFIFDFTYLCHLHPLRDIPSDGISNQFRRDDTRNWSINEFVASIFLFYFSRVVVVVALFFVEKVCLCYFQFVSEGNNGKVVVCILHATRQHTAKFILHERHSNNMAARDNLVGTFRKFFRLAGRKKEQEASTERPNKNLYAHIFPFWLLLFAERWMRGMGGRTSSAQLLHRGKSTRSQAKHQNFLNFHIKWNSVYFLVHFWLAMGSRNTKQRTENYFQLSFLCVLAPQREREMAEERKVSTRESNRKKAHSHIEEEYQNNLLPLFGQVCMCVSVCFSVFWVCYFDDVQESVCVKFWTVPMLQSIS